MRISSGFLFFPSRTSCRPGPNRLNFRFHPDPERAMSDGFQSLTPPAFHTMMTECRKVAPAVGRQIS